MKTKRPVGRDLEPIVTVYMEDGCQVQVIRHADGNIDEVKYVEIHSTGKMGLHRHQRAFCQSKFWRILFCVLLLFLDVILPIGIVFL